MYNNNGGGGFGGNRGGGFGGDRGPRQMIQGDWVCKQCGKEIKELPFEPRDPDSVLCKECHMQNRPQRSEGGFGGDRGPRQMVQGNWTCNECGKEITELPFMPSGDRPVTCRDCHAKQRASRPSFGGGRY